jgi:hypothetical protein
LLTTCDGPVFRWTLRGPNGRILLLRLLVNCPVFPDVAYFYISDNKSAKPLDCATVRSLREVDEVLSRCRDVGAIS